MTELDARWFTDEPEEDSYLGESAIIKANMDLPIGRKPSRCGGKGVIRWKPDALASPDNHPCFGCPDCGNWQHASSEADWHRRHG